MNNGIKHTDLNRFLVAQENKYEQALAEIKSGKKRSHWMWFIFPIYKGLGLSETAQYYAIQNMDEAEAYLHHPILGNRLREISLALLQHTGDNPHEIFGSPDDMKLKSCMTLFSLLDEDETKLFERVLKKYFDNQIDNKTIELVSS